MKTLYYPTPSQAEDLFVLDDLALLSRYQCASDQRCLEELLHRYVPFIHRVCTRYFPRENSDDLCMRILEAFLQRIDAVEVRKFATWVRILCYAEGMKELRSKRKQRHVMLIHTSESGSIARTFGEENEPDSHCRKSWTLLHRAMKSLPAEQRECIELFYYQEYTYKQICNETGMTYNQVKSHLQNGRRNLRNRLRSHPHFIRRMKQKSVGQVKHG